MNLRPQTQNAQSWRGGIVTQMYFYMCMYMYILTCVHVIIRSCGYFRVACAYTCECIWICAKFFGHVRYRTHVRTVFALDCHHMSALSVLTVNYQIHLRTHQFWRVIFNITLWIMDSKFCAAVLFPNVKSETKSPTYRGYD